MRPYVVIRYIGLILLFVAGLLFLSAFVALAEGSDPSFLPLLETAMLTVCTGLFPMIFVKDVRQISIREAYAIVAGAWIAVCLMGMLPYLFYRYEFHFIDALFESVSGFTTTGASIINDLESLPRGLLFWRMSTAWIGGIGIVMFALVLLPSTRGIGTSLSNMEMSNLARYQYSSARRQSLIRILLLTYTGLTFGTMLLLKFTGMGWFDALTHAMSACSSCGFSTRNANIAAFDSPLIESVLIVAMLLAGTHFGVIIRMARGKFKTPEVFRTYLGFLLVCSALITLSLWAGKTYGGFFPSLRQALFNVVSLTTTTGFTTTDTNVWPPICIVILTVCSLICACSGSTSGGIKMDRVLIAAKSIRRRVILQRHIHGVRNVKLDGKRLEEETVVDILNFICAYMLVAATGTLLYTCFGADLQTGFSAAIACLGNVGPGFGAIGASENFAAMTIPFKAISIVLMLLGRLEIFGILQIFYNGLHR
ncbi:MAG: TrkH family potassium uptake protein [Bacteroidales bacterium]|nr:TrkH family potassium uptake protein [Bacteroidales bacterium]